MCQHSPQNPPIHSLKASLFALGLDRSQGALQMCLAIASGDRKPLVDMTPTYMTPRCHVLFDKISSNLQEAEHWVVHCNVWWHMIDSIIIYTYMYCTFFKLVAKAAPQVPWSQGKLIHSTKTWGNSVLNNHHPKNRSHHQPRNAYALHINGRIIFIHSHPLILATEKQTDLWSKSARRLETSWPSTTGGYLEDHPI